ncbi:MAG: GNAT family N-acetyltransferase [Candidatus Solibacter sp.]|nr:GNAT family N-acetyltransferase [Candidatus Solibacter sp.]
MTQVEIRDASEDDLPAVLRILAESGIDGGESFTQEEAREHFARIRRRPGFRLLVAEVDGEIAGTYVLQIMEKLGKRGTPAGVVEDVAVLPSRQGQGIGRAMMEHAQDACRRAGCYKLALSSNLRREDAHRFYDSLGFERHGFSFVTRF